MKNDKLVYVWLEVPIGIIPRDNQEAALLTDTQIFLSPDNHTHFIRTKVNLKEGKYLFACFTGGWLNLSYRIYLELDRSNNTIPYSNVRDISLKKIATFELCEMSTLPGNRVLILDKEYRLRASKASMSQLPRFDYYEFVPSRITNLIEDVKKILKKILLK